MALLRRCARGLALAVSSRPQGRSSLRVSSARIDWAPSMANAGAMVPTCARTSPGAHFGSTLPHVVVMPRAALTNGVVAVAFSTRCCLSHKPSLRRLRSTTEPVMLLARRVALRLEYAALATAAPAATPAAPGAAPIKRAAAAPEERAAVTAATDDAALLRSTAGERALSVNGVMNIGAAEGDMAACTTRDAGWRNMASSVSVLLRCSLWKLVERT